MLRVLQGAGLIVAAVLLISCARRREPEPAFDVVGSSLIEDYLPGPVPLVIQTDEKLGALMLRVMAEEVVLPDMPEVPNGLSVTWDGAGHIVREGFGLRLKTAGRIDADLEIKVRSDLLVRITTGSGVDMASAIIGLPASIDTAEVSLKW